MQLPSGAVAADRLLRQQRLEQAHVIPALDPRPSQQLRPGQARVAQAQAVEEPEQIGRQRRQLVGNQQPGLGRQQLAPTGHLGRCLGTAHPSAGLDGVVRGSAVVHRPTASQAAVPGCSVASASGSRVAGSAPRAAR